MNDAPEMLAIVGGTLIDGNGGTPIEDGVILIDGTRIMTVGDRSTQIPPHAKVIAATGKFVIPGLMDAYVYLVDGVTPSTMIRYEGRYDELAVEAAQITLRNGITTVFDMWGPRDYLVKARTAVNQGLSVGSRIYFAGNFVGISGPYSDDIRPNYKEAVGDVFASRINSQWQENVGQELTWTSPEHVRQEIRKYVQSGIDFLNYAVNVHRPGAFQYIVFSPRVQQVIVEEAHRAGLPVGAIFAFTGEGLHLALSAGVDLVHGCGSTIGETIPAETVAQIAQRQIPCSIVPCTTEALEWYRQRENNHSVLKMTSESDLNVQALLRADAVLLLGTQGALYSADMTNSSLWRDWNPPENTFTLGDGHVNWLLAMQQKGMKSMAALMAATRNIARAYKVDKDLGTLEPGKLADLVILDRNPLQHAENYRSIRLVMKEGKIVDRDALPSQRLLTAQSAPGTQDPEGRKSK